MQRYVMESLGRANASAASVTTRTLITSIQWKKGLTKFTIVLQSQSIAATTAGATPMVLQSHPQHFPDRLSFRLATSTCPTMLNKSTDPLLNLSADFLDVMDTTLCILPDPSSVLDVQPFPESWMPPISCTMRVHP